MRMLTCCSRKRYLLLCLGLFLLALLPRIAGLEAFVTSDEPNWASRSAAFLRALQSKDLAETFSVGHPGVTTMWAGAIGMAFQCWLRPDLSRDLAIIEEGGRGEQLRKLPSLLPAAKLPIALLTAVGVGGIYFLTKALLGGRIAFLSAMLIAIDPFYLAHSRVLHLDALTTTFMTLSLLSFLAYLNRRRSTAYLLLSGATAGLAFLSKSPSFFLIPFAGLLLAATCYIRPLDWRKVASRSGIPFALWGGSAALFFLILWPAMWVNPVETLRQVLASAMGYAATPHEKLNFFLGQVRPDPGPWLYPLAVLFRITPLTTLGIITSIPLLFKGEQEGKTVLRWLSVYILLFGVFMSVGAKKFDRYLLPIFPLVDIMAAAGLWATVEAMGFKWGDKWRRWAIVGLALATILQAGSVLSYHPYYLSYFNPLAGGASQAVKTILVGWGEGMEQAAEYLNRKEGAQDLTVAVWDTPPFAPYFVGRAVAAESYNSANVDYVVQYLSAWQRGIPAHMIEIYGDQEPEHVVRIKGIDYAWIYRNDHYVDVIHYLEEQAQEGDAIIVNTPSLFTMQYRGDLPVYVVPPNPTDSEAGVVSALNQIAREHHHVWYLHYDGPWDHERLVLFQLETKALLLARHSFSPFGATVTRYSLPDGISFSAITPQPLVGPSFGGELRLVGCWLGQDAIESGRQQGVLLQWQATQAMERNYTVSLHLVDEMGHLWGQVDKLLRDDSYRPTSQWEKGESDQEWYLLPVAPDTPPGRYLLKAVLYHLGSGQRLDALDPNRTPLGTEYTIGSVEVRRRRFAPTQEELSVEYPLQASFAKRIELLGYETDAETVKVGERIGLTLIWRALNRVEGDYDVLVQWQDEAGRVWAEEQLSNDFYPTSQWVQGEVIRGQYDLIVDAAAPEGESWLVINLVEKGTERRLVEKGVLLTKVSVEPLERRFIVPEGIQYPTRAQLADRVTLLGYDLDRTTVKVGGPLYLTLYWQAQRHMETSYKVFTHLLDAQNKIWGQRDSIPVGGTRPTTGWLEGEVIVDEYEIPVKPDAPSGEYVLEVGMYDALTGERLPVYINGQRLPEDRVLLEPLIVVEK